MSSYLSKNFTLEELSKSDTAIRLGIDNIPTEKEIQNLKALCHTILEPVRAQFKKAIQVHSAFRSLNLNRKIGSSDGSDHVIGCAADIEIVGVDNPKLALWVAENCEFNQVILEFYNPKDGPNSGWVHVAYHPDWVSKNKRQRLIINKSGTSTF